MTRNDVPTAISKDYAGENEPVKNKKNEQVLTNLSSHKEKPNGFSFLTSKTLPKINLYFYL